jgi:hypothetical protein
MRLWFFSRSGKKMRFWGGLSAATKPELGPEPSRLDARPGGSGLSRRNRMTLGGVDSITPGEP